MPEVEEEDPQDKQLAGVAPEQPGHATQSGSQALSEQQDLLQTNAAQTQGMTSADQQAVGSSSAGVEAPEDESESAAAAALAEAAAAAPVLPKQVRAGTLQELVKSWCPLCPLTAQSVWALHFSQLDVLVHASFIGIGGYHTYVGKPEHQAQRIA